MDALGQRVGRDQHRSARVPDGGIVTLRKEDISGGFFELTDKPTDQPKLPQAPKVTVFCLASCVFLFSHVLTIGPDGGPLPDAGAERPVGEAAGDTGARQEEER